MPKLGKKRDVAPRAIGHEPSPQDAGRKAEKQSMKDVGAQATPASGATPWEPSDGVGGRFRYEHKQTRRKQVPFTRDVLVKIWEEAVCRGQQPVAIAEMSSMPRPVPERWVMIPFDLWLEINGPSSSDE